MIQASSTEHPTVPLSYTDPARQAANSPSEAASQISEFLTFKLGREEYGMDILRVQEIRSYEEPTRLTHTGSSIKGIINLRGVIVPIIDMRLQFGLDSATYNTTTVVIMINIANRVIGMVVDSVSDVVTLKPEQIRPTPNFQSAVSEDHVLAIGAHEGRMLILLDIEKLMGSPDMGLVERLQ